MSGTIYIEGGGDSKDLKIRCRQGFSKLFEKCGLRGRMPRAVACGSRNQAFDKFKTKHASPATGKYVGLLVDSEDPVRDVDKTWEHLVGRDSWQRPQGVDDEQVLFMTTCMETLVATDHVALGEHYGSDLRPAALPPLTNMETRSRREVLLALGKATADSKKAYRKGERAFDILGKLDPDTLREHLPSFRRILGILQRRL